MSLIPSLLEASTCCPPAPGTLVLAVHETRVRQWVHNACALTSLTWDTRTSFLLSPSPQPSSKPVPTHHANVRERQLATATQYNHLPQTRHLSVPYPLTESSLHNWQLSLGQGMTLLTIFIIWQISHWKVMSYFTKKIQWAKPNKCELMSFPCSPFWPTRLTDSGPRTAEISLGRSSAVTFSDRCVPVPASTVQGWHLKTSVLFA